MQRSYCILSHPSQERPSGQTTGKMRQAYGTRPPEVPGESDDVTGGAARHFSRREQEEEERECWV